MHLSKTHKTRRTPIQILEARKKRGYKPGVDNDGHKVGLAMDPGGAAGVVSLAAADELDKLGLLDFVDSYYGISVGNVNALYAATRQFQDGFDVYTDLMPGRFKTKRKGLIPEIHLEALRHAVLVDRPFRADLLPKNTPVVIGITRLENFAPVMLKSNEMDADKFVDLAIKGCHLPYITVGPVPRGDDGYHYSDSTLSWPSAIELAKQDGCTDIVSLANILPYKSSFLAGMAAKILNRIVAKFIKNYDPKLEAGGILRVSSGFNVTLYKRFMRYKKQHGRGVNESLFVDNGVFVERLYPKQLKNLPGLMTSSKQRMLVGIKAGRLGASWA